MQFERRRAVSRLFVHMVAEEGLQIETDDLLFLAFRSLSILQRRCFRSA